MLTDLLIRREAGEAIDPAPPWPPRWTAPCAARSTRRCGRHRHRQRRRAAARRLPDLHPRAHVGLRRRIQAQDRQGLPGGAGADRDVPAPLSPARQDLQRPAGDRPRCATSTPRTSRTRSPASSAARPRPSRFAETFITAPSPGIVATTMMNAYYNSHEDYLMALARELRPEYRAIHEAGLVLQIDAPDLAMERTMTFQDLSEARVPQDVRAARGGHQHGARGHPARPRAAALLLGQLGGPARPRHRRSRPSCRSSTRRTPAPSRSSSPTRATSTSTRPCAPTRCPRTGC